MYKTAILVQLYHYLVLNRCHAIKCLTSTLTAQTGHNSSGTGLCWGSL